MSVTNIIENPLIDLEGLNTFKEEIEKEIDSNGGKLSDTLNVTKTVGGITSGTTYNKDTEFETVFRDMLNPTENPSLTNPSAVLTVAGSTLLESGSSVEKTFTVEFNRGTISPANGTSGKRSGAATGYSLNGSAAQNENTFTEVVTSLNNSFSATVSYEAGEQPKNNKGENYSTPLPAGDVNSNTITFEFVEAIWANTTDIETIQKLPLVSSNTKSKEFMFPAQTVQNVETFDIPANWTVTGVFVLNEMNNKWEDCSFEFAISNTTHIDAGGNTINYKRYSDSRGYQAGPRRVKVEFK